MQTLSSGPSFCASPMKKPLLRMLWWLSVAPFGAPVVPLVNWMLMGSSNCSRPASSARRARWTGVPRAAISANGMRARGVAADLDHGLQQRQAAAGAVAQLGQHGQIVAGLEAGGGDQGAAADLVQRVFQLVGAVGRVDVDQDQAGLGGGELRHHPLRVVGRPDADPVAGLEAQRQQAGGEGIDLGLQLGPGPAQALLADDQGIALRPARGGAVEMDADGLAEQRDVRGPVHVAEPGHHGGLPFWGEPTPAGGSGQRGWSARAGCRRRHGAMCPEFADRAAERELGADRPDQPSDERGDPPMESLAGARQVVTVAAVRAASRRGQLRP